MKGVSDAMFEATMFVIDGLIKCFDLGSKVLGRTISFFHK